MRAACLLLPLSRERLGLPPLLYLCANSAACYSFVEDARATCETREAVNYALAATLTFSGFAPTLYVLEPLSLRQVMDLDLQRSQFVAGGFAALALSALTSSSSPLWPPRNAWSSTGVVSCRGVKATAATNSAMAATKGR